MVEGMAKNYIDYEEYPATCEIQNKCVAMSKDSSTRNGCTR